MNKCTKTNETTKMKRLFGSFNVLLHIFWSEQKQTSFIFLLSRFTCRQPSDVFTPISAARTSSFAEKHRRLDLSFIRDSCVKNEIDRLRVWLSNRFLSIKSTDFQHLPSQSSRVCCVKSNWAWQSISIGIYR